MPAVGRTIDLQNDPRSSTAILRGNGDGRDRCYVRFVEHWRQKQPDLPEDDLFSGFDRHSRQAMYISHRWFGKYGYISGRAAITLLRIWMFFGWYGSQAAIFNRQPHAAGVMPDSQYWRHSRATVARFQIMPTIDLQNEPRSSTAILRGNGDGRDRCYERFVEYWRRKQPDLPEDDLCSGFERYSSQAMYISHRWFGKYGYISGRAAITLLRIWMLFGWYGSQATIFNRQPHRR
jgi:uncharacterized short protein YbdD (DUF466 family)